MGLDNLIYNLFYIKKIKIFLLIILYKYEHVKKIIMLNANKNYLFILYVYFVSLCFNYVFYTIVTFFFYLNHETYHFALTEHGL